MKNGREEKYNEEYGLAYGRDHAVGLFVQVWRLNKKFSTGAFENQPDDENLVVDRDEFQGTLTIKEIVSIAEEYGFDLSAELPEEEIQVIFRPEK